MGHTIVPLSNRKLSGKPIFPNRFVIEICEKVHTHYKNLRLTNTTADWISIAEAYRDALQRWKQRGKPSTGKGQHIELCRKTIYSEAENEDLLINLNNNLYVPNKDKIYSEGAEFTDPTYIHLKIRDIRLELSLDEFREVAIAIRQAEERLKDSNICTSV